jgi:glycosyltransferase involved in cell wall biosynthesis
VRIGIGITTRNRPKALEAALRHFHHFPAADSRIVIVDDASEPDYFDLVKPFIIANPNTRYFRSSERTGVGGAKNLCLWHLRDCEHVFLFDDDTWPMVEGWAEIWISDLSNVGHAMYLAATPGGKASAVPVDITPIKRMGGIVSYTNGLGALLYFSRECLNALGAFPVGKNPYGYEHVQMSLRARKAGFTLGELFISPAVAIETIYSKDVSFDCFGFSPPLPVSFTNWGSSVSKMERASHVFNAALLKEPPVYLELKDPYVHADHHPGS